MKTEQAAQTVSTERAYVRPLTDVFESAAEYLLVIDVPGAAKDSIDLQVHDGELRIGARRLSENAGDRVREEKVDADYGRTFAVPEDIDVSKIEAELEAGVLRVHLPKAASKQARKIEIRAS